MTTACFLVLCGLPAAGKTTFGKGFTEFLQLRHELENALPADLPVAQSVERDYHVAHLVYDDMLPVKLSTQTFQIQPAEWKLRRRTINHCLDQLLSRLLLPGRVADNENCEVSAVFNMSTKHLDTRRPVILVLDDNMYYASMRYEIYQLARKYSTGYAQLYFPAELSQASDRNLLRGCTVPDDVISSMAQRFDVPKAADNCWESRTAVWTEDDHKSHNFLKVMKLVEEAFRNPVAPPVDDLPNCAESRVICSANFIHQSDCILRRLVTENISTIKAELSLESTGLRSHAQRLNETRQTILDDMRLHRLLAPPGVAESTASGGQKSLLCEFVANVFKEYIAKDC